MNTSLSLTSRYLNSVTSCDALADQRCSPFEMELEIFEDAATGQKCATHAGEYLPTVEVSHTPRVRHFIGLLDELTVELISERS